MKSLGWFLLMSLFVFTCRAEPAPRVFPNTAYGFKLVLNDDWDKLPERDFKVLNERATRIRSDWKSPAVHGGYSMTNAPGYVFPPYALVRAAESGSAHDAKTVHKEWREKGVLPDAIELDEPILDPALNAFVGRGGVTFQNGLRVSGTFAVFPTRLGAIKIYMYVAQQDLENHPEIVGQLLKGVQIAQDNKVGWTPPKAGLWIGLGSIVAIILALWLAKPAT